MPSGEKSTSPRRPADGAIGESRSEPEQQIQRAEEVEEVGQERSPRESELARALPRPEERSQVLEEQPLLERPGERTARSTSRTGRLLSCSEMLS